MGVTIIRRQTVYHLIAEHDLYLNADKSKVLVVKDGEEVPSEAAFVLAGKGGMIPPMYAGLLEALEAEVPEPEAKVAPESEPLPQAVAAEPEVKPQPKLAKPTKEKAISA